MVDLFYLVILLVVITSKNCIPITLFSEFPFDSKYWLPVGRGEEEGNLAFKLN